MKKEKVTPVEPGLQPDGTCVHSDGQVSIVDCVPWACGKIKTQGGDLVQPVFLVFTKTDKYVPVWSKNKRKPIAWRTVLCLLAILVVFLLWAFR